MVSYIVVGNVSLYDQFPFNYNFAKQDDIVNSINVFMTTKSAKNTK